MRDSIFSAAYIMSVQKVKKESYKCKDILELSVDLLTVQNCPP
jgi:hypothetical protein